MSWRHLKGELGSDRSAQSKIALDDDHFNDVEYVESRTAKNCALATSTSLCQEQVGLNSFNNHTRPMKTRLEMLCQQT